MSYPVNTVQACVAVVGGRYGKHRGWYRSWRCGRKYARVDFRIETGFGVIPFEVDERQHAHYTTAQESQRVRRIDGAYREQNDGYVHIVRYNPDSYRSEAGLIVKHPREEHVAAIQLFLSYTPKHAFTISYCFYRLEKRLPEILRNDYALREHVGIVI